MSGWLLGAACGTPDYEVVDLQVDLAVTEATDPWQVLRGVRVCLRGLEGGGLHADYPLDPGAYVLPGLPRGRSVELVVQALDLNPTELERGEHPRVLAEAFTGTLTLPESGPSWTQVPFALCTSGECGALCDDTGGQAGAARAGLRRVADEGSGAP